MSYWPAWSRDGILNKELALLPTWRVKRQDLGHVAEVITLMDSGLEPE